MPKTLLVIIILNDTYIHTYIHTKMPTMTSAAIRSLVIDPDRRNPNPNKPTWGPPEEATDVGPTWEEEEEEEFFEPRESISIASGCSGGSDSDDMFGSGRGSKRGSVSGQSDYYEAAEDFFSDGSFPNSSPSFSANSWRELKALRCNLIEEVERHKKAEMHLLHIRKQWKRMAKCLFKLGLSFPDSQDSANVKLVPDPAELCQEIIVKRFVSDAVERGLARAEAEAVAEEILDSKDSEISRLRDRVHYYEAVNHEMSQWNQETVELARWQRMGRKTRWRLIWGCVGLSITIGASLLAYSHFPHSVKDTLATSSLDASSSLTSATPVETEGGCLDS